MTYKNVQLRNYNTFGLYSIAKEFFTFNTEKMLLDAISEGKLRDKNVLILGGGSNILFTDNVEGIVIHPETKGISFEERNDDRVIISAGSGVQWDDLVKWSVENGLSGLENLSFIPGLVGATPVQNIGAYGVEASDTIVKVRFIDLETGKINEIKGSECSFGYRNSIFKQELRKHFIVTRVWYSLSLHPVLNTTYGDVKEETDRLGGTNLPNIRQAIINIRQRKLPDPSITGNAGSFFRNPVVTQEELAILKKSFPDIPHFVLSDGSAKVAAAWLIEQCGWKGYRRGDAGVHPRQALVLVNYGKATGKEILSLSEDIKSSVENRFKITLCREVEVV